MDSSSAKRDKLFQLRKGQIRRLLSGSDRKRLKSALQELDSITESMDVPGEVRDLAMIIFRSSLECGISQSRSTRIMVAASVYASFRIQRSNRTLDQVARNARVSKKLLSKYYRLIVRKLELNIPIPEPHNYLQGIQSGLNLDEETMNASTRILEEARKRNLLVGRDPRGMAASAVYLAALITEVRVTQSALANLAGVTVVTVRNRYSELRSRLGIDLNDNSSYRRFLTEDMDAISS